MFKALILWLLSAALVLGGIGFGFYKWAELGAKKSRIETLSSMEYKLSDQAKIIEEFIQNIEQHSKLTAYLGLNKSGVPILKSKEGSLNLPSNIILSLVGSYLPSHTENSSYGFYFKDEFIVVIRELREAEEIEHKDSKLLAHIIPNEKLNIVLNTGTQYFIEDSVKRTYSKSIPKTIEPENLKAGGDLQYLKSLPGISIQLVGQDSYTGWEQRLREVANEKNWQLMFGAVILGLLILLGGLLYHADGMGILEQKIGQFEYRFGVEIEKQLNQKLGIERREAHRDVSEGVHSVLKSPISAIRADVNMFLVGVTQEQLEQKANEINKQLDRIDKFIESLRSSNNPGQISKARCNPKAIIESLLPEWEVQVKKYGAKLKTMFHDVGEISLPERDVRAIFSNILQFEAERVKKNMYEKNVTARMEQDQQGLHFSIVDNMKTEGEDIAAYKDHMALAIAIGTLERNYCSLNIEEISEGGLQLSFDLAAQEDQTLDSLTMVSQKLDES